MIDVTIPGYGKLVLKHLVVDYNGTIALDGQPIGGILQKLNDLKDGLQIHVVTADTFHSVRQVLQNYPFQIKILKSIDQHIQKKDYVEDLGADFVVSIGNGRNDRLMLAVSALGIVVVNEEGTSTETLVSADVLTRSVRDALELLIFPKRLIATLRS